jgi:hypothetical protein
MPAISNVDDRGLLMLGAEHADDRLQRPHPAQRARLAEALPQRIGFGHGKSRMIDGISSAMISSAERPDLEMIAT